MYHPNDKVSVIVCQEGGLPVKNIKKQIEANIEKLGYLESTTTICIS